MSEDRAVHLVERAVERMAELGIAGAPPLAAAAATSALPQAPLPQAAPPRATPQPAAAGQLGETVSKLAEGDRTADPAPAVSVSMSTLEAAGMAVGGTRRSRIAEECNVTAGRMMRTLRTARRNTVANAIANLLLVTSSKPNEGKSFSAINLAASMALSRMTEVVLIDLDSKPGSLTEILGLGERPGLFDLVANPGLRPETLVVATAVPGFAFLPNGRAARDGPGSTERSITRPVVAVIESIARRFSNRLMILDSTPCLATSDASTLAGAVGQIALIIEAERTQHGDIEAALELLRPCPNITLLLNKVRQSTTHGFGDYDYYNG
jgi:receptor protein-tyrosine kinase